MHTFIQNTVKTSQLALALLALIFIGFSCRELSVEDLRNQIDDENVIIPAEFDFKTTGEQVVNIKVLGNDGQPFANIPLTLSIPVSEDSFEFFYRGFTNDDGVLEANIQLSPNVTEVLLQTTYIGLPQNHLIPIEVLDGYVISNKASEPDGFNAPKTAKPSNKYGDSDKFKYLGSWDNKGVPNYKKTIRDVIPQAMLDDINSSLPEYKPVPQYNPEYLDDDIETNSNIVKMADVWVTFVHEGAGYKNVLGFYTHHVDTPPQSTNDIEDLNIIFPNVSYSGSGGGLISGDKVHIGRFDPGTVIGWFLVADGYNYSSQTVGDGRHVVYSDNHLNPESNDDLKQHIVQLYDETRDIIILSFEDLRRDGSCDNDFNDAIFYVSSNPVEGIERTNLESTKKAIDTDGDGVYDFDDEFPFDPTKSSSSNSPTSSTNGSMAYEDSWPNMGDYDFNDMVVDYNYEYFTNAGNEVTALTATFNLQAIGASYNNGFGFQLDIDPALVDEVDGCLYTDNLITNNANGTETNQQKATIIVFDNAHKHMRRPGNGTYVNTEANADLVPAKEFVIEITFTQGIPFIDLGKPPYNPFIFAAGTRGREIHMMDSEPTDLANFNLFGTAADISDPTIDRYYQNRDNMPWVLHTPTTFTYPLERNNIYECYNYFENWAESEGRTNKDWYEDLPGNSNSIKLFQRN